MCLAHNSTGNNAITLATEKENRISGLEGETVEPDVKRGVQYPPHEKERKELFVSLLNV